MSDIVDLVVVGAGPAGIEAACEARRAGLRVTVVDDQPTPGGQIWRGVERVAVDRERFGPDYLAGVQAAAKLRACGAVYEAGAQVWQIEPGWRVFLSVAGQARIVEARAVVLAVGAQERPVPFPGWTLPGVLTVGAAQILLKTSRQIPSAPVVVAGSGPLPLLYMSQLLAFGGRIAAYLDTAPARNRVAAAAHLLRAAIGGMSDLTKGLGLLADLRKARVKTVRNVTEIEASGADALAAVRYRTADDSSGEIATSVLLVHEGVVPNVHATMAVGCAHEWRADQLAFVPQADSWGETTQEGLFVAGDGGGIGGVRAATVRGQLAAIGVARRLGRLSDEAAAAAAAPLRRQLALALASRPFLDALYRPRAQIFAPDNATVVCRCEEVTAGEIRAAAIGREGPNQVKAFTRAGMGPCQGRQCAYTVAHILAAAQGRSVAEVGFHRIRPPLKPITLGELASLEAP